MGMPAREQSASLKGHQQLYDHAREGCTRAYPTTTASPCFRRLQGEKSNGMIKNQFSEAEEYLILLCFFLSVWGNATRLLSYHSLLLAMYFKCLFFSYEGRETRK
jgi:hypothetical protein